MTTAPLGDARDHLSEYVADVQRTHNRVTITRYGQPAAVLISADELASLDETVDILSTPGALEESVGPRPRSTMGSTSPPRR